MEVKIDGVKYVPVPDLPADKGLLGALEVRFDSDAGDNLTVRDYLCALLETLWREREGFSGKRPFGNSGWELALFAPLIVAGHIPGKVDEDGFVDDCDESAASTYIAQLINAAFYGVERSND